MLIVFLIDLQKAGHVGNPVHNAQAVEHYVECLIGVGFEIPQGIVKIEEKVLICFQYIWNCVYICKAIDMLCPFAKV